MSRGFAISGHALMKFFFGAICMGEPLWVAGYKTGSTLSSHHVNSRIAIETNQRVRPIDWSGTSFAKERKHDTPADLLAHRRSPYSHCPRRCSEPRAPG